MLKKLFLTGILVFSSYGAFAESWIQIGSTTQGTQSNRVYGGKESLDTKNHKGWTKVVFDTPQTTGQFQKPVKSAVWLAEANCKQNEIRYLSSQLIFDDGKSVVTNDKVANWKTVYPDTIADALHHWLCKPEQFLKK